MQYRHLNLALLQHFISLLKTILPEISPVPRTKAAAG